MKRELAQTRFLVYQDNPGEGFQASIFKRFYWWEEECTQRIKERFGVEIVRKSFKELGAIAQKILLSRGVTITAFSSEIAGVKGSVEDFSVIESKKSLK